MRAHALQPRWTTHTSGTVILAQSNFSWNRWAVSAALHQPPVLNPPFTKM
jgi:hypothetical protein